MKQTTAELQHNLQHKLNRQIKQLLLERFFGPIHWFSAQDKWYLEVNHRLILKASTYEAIKAAVDGLAYMATISPFTYHCQAWQRFATQFGGSPTELERVIPDGVQEQLTEIVLVEKKLREYEAILHIAPDQAQDWIDGYLYKPDQREMLFDYASQFKQRQGLRMHLQATLRPQLHQFITFIEKGQGKPINSRKLFPLGLAVLWAEGLPLSWLDGLYTDLTRLEKKPLVWEEYPGTMFVLMADELIFVGAPAEFYAFIWGIALALTLKIKE